MKTTAQLTYEKVRFDEAKDVHLVVSLAAPHLDAAAPRPPVCVIPVLDVSGSMAGEKLHFAKQSVMKLVDHLAPGDFCGVVVFSTEVETLAPPAEMTQARKDELKALVGRLARAPPDEPRRRHARRARPREGGEAARGHARPRHPLHGRARERRARRSRTSSSCGSSRRTSATATLSAFGYGDDADQELLRDLSTKGKGNYAYVQGPEDALTAFARELGGLLSTYAQAIEVRVTPREGVELTDVVSDVDAREEGGSVVLRVPDLLADEVRNLVLGVRLRPAARPARRPRGRRRRAGRVRAVRRRPRGAGALRRARDGAVRRPGGRAARADPERGRRWSRSPSSSGRRSRRRRRRGAASSRRPGR